jgi:hypothetical protein
MFELICSRVYARLDILFVASYIVKAIGSKPLKNKKVIYVGSISIRV